MRSAKEIEGYAIDATAGQIGHIKNFYLDDEIPVSLQHEMEFWEYFNYPYYWGGAGYRGVQSTRA